MKVCMHKNCVELNIKDNGIGCNTIIKSNGLKGIENRIIALGGIVDFISSQRCGFLINATIPV